MAQLVRTFFLIFTTMLFVILCYVPAVNAVSRCSSIYENHKQIQEEMFRLISEYRKSHLEKTDIQELTVNRIPYKILGLLGESSFQVYLATNPNGQLVVVKKIINSRGLNFFEESVPLNSVRWVSLEQIKTQFFQEKEISVAKVLDTEINGDVGYVVKEYKLGITPAEFKQLRLNPKYSAVSKQINISDLYKSITAYQQTYKTQFIEWLKKNGLEDLELPTIGGIYDSRENREILLHKGDIKEANMLFDIATMQWIILDP